MNGNNCEIFTLLKKKYILYVNFYNFMYDYNIIYKFDILVRSLFFGYNLFFEN